jgi:very-short-patch-repair endonuclease
LAGFWAEVPGGRVTRLVGATPRAIALSLDPLPDDAPAVVTCRPRVVHTPAVVVADVLDHLERAAVALYPSWLPGAGPIAGPGGAAAAAVRVVALQAGAATHHFGPFLAALAGRAAGTGRRNGHRFPDEVRAAGLARVIAASYGRASAALLVTPADDLDAAGEQVLIASCAWLARHGGFAAWLTGPAVGRADTVRTVTIRCAGGAAAAVAGDDGPAPLPARAGAPHPASRTEQALEAALAAHAWAGGREWNRTLQADPLANPVRVDLMWPAEHCAIEIDGPEHRGALRYEADRRRDTMLQLAGFTVLRFTNEQVADDLAAVLAQIEQLLTTRRNRKD